MSRSKKSYSPRSAYERDKREDPKPGERWKFVWRTVTTDHDLQEITAEAAMMIPRSGQPVTIEALRRSQFFDAWDYDVIFDDGFQFTAMGDELGKLPKRRI